MRPAARRAPRPAPPALRRAARSRSPYFFESRKPSGSTLSIDASVSSKLPGSRVSSSRRAAVMGKWCSHCGHTPLFFSTSSVTSCARQPGHLVHIPAGTLRFSSARSSSLSSRLYQAIRFRRPTLRGTLEGFHTSPDRGSAGARRDLSRTLDPALEPANTTTTTDSGGAVGGVCDRKSPVHFGVWHPISEASAAAPDAAGVLRRAQKV